MKNKISAALVAACITSPLAIADPSNELVFELDTTQMDSITAGGFAAASASADANGPYLATTNTRLDGGNYGDSFYASAFALGVADPGGQASTSTSAVTQNNEVPTKTITQSFSQNLDSISLSYNFSITVPYYSPF